MDMNEEIRKCLDKFKKFSDEQVAREAELAKILPACPICGHQPAWVKGELELCSSWFVAVMHLGRQTFVEGNVHPLYAVRLSSVQCRRNQQ
jgi:transposase-like protein